MEYQGQQINQQRVALSNEVMGLYQEYNNLDVPVPPAVNDYQKTVYKLDSTYNGYQIDNFTKIIDGEYADYYDVSLSCETEIPKAYTYSAKDSVITAQKGSNGYSYLNFQLGTESYVYDENNPDTSTITKITSDYEKYSGLSTIMSSQGLTSGTFYMYMKNGVAYYTSENDLDSTAFEVVDGKNMYYGSYTFDYQGAQKTVENVHAKAALSQDSSGRLMSIQILDCDDADLVGNTYSITTASEDDQAAYEDAMNEYYYQKQLYEREVERINQKTETLQKEDRSLEMQLNQLDTEQKAISTEMESISKVIEDTINSVFKTYNS